MSNAVTLVSMQVIPSGIRSAALDAGAFMAQPCCAHHLQWV